MRLTNLFALLTLSLVSRVCGQGTAADYERSEELVGRFGNKIYHGAIDPHWLDGGKRFWYRVAIGPGKEQYVVVDVQKGTKTTVTDPRSIPGQNGGAIPSFLPAHPSGGSGEESFMTVTNNSRDPVTLNWIDGEGTRHRYGTLTPGQSLLQHTYEGHVWLLTDTNGSELAAYTATTGVCSILFDGTKPAPNPPASKRKSVRENASPDGKWEVTLQEHNVWLKPMDGGASIQLSADGKAGDEYGAMFRWSPDGQYLAAIRTESGQPHKVFLVQSSPEDQEQPRLTSFDYLKPGDRIPHPRLMIFEVNSKREIEVDQSLSPNPWALTEFHWAPDSSKIYYIYNQRGHQILRLLSASPVDGKTQQIVEETSKTFIDYSQKTWISYLDRTGEAIWTSERSGYNHVYLVELSNGHLRPITSGPWVVRSVENVDAERRELILKVIGAIPGQDPYFFQFAKVRIDGSDFRFLTQKDATHKVNWSPDRATFVATFSRVDMPPVSELRRSSDGTLIASLEEADISQIQADGWQSPERFVSKGRDGQTDIYGVIYRPTHFDPKLHYPVIEDIYAGPHDFFVPKSFAPYRGSDRLAELGFIVVQIDGMGTNWRSKAFHDVCYQNLADAGFPDRIAWLRAAAKTRPWMDLSRVGIYGTSAGGQSAASAVMRFGDFYKAAVADCGCHDNRMDKIWWNEAWMGWPVGPEYAANSNVTAAKNLKGKLYLMVGEVDTNVDPASTMQVVHALIRAGKDFDLLVVPNSDHGVLGKPYPWRRMEDFFIRNLWSKEPRQ